MWPCSGLRNWSTVQTNVNTAYTPKVGLCVSVCVSVQVLASSCVMCVRTLRRWGGTCVSGLWAWYVNYAFSRLFFFSSIPWKQRRFRRGRRILNSSRYSSVLTCLHKNKTRVKHKVCCKYQGYRLKPISARRGSEMCVGMWTIWTSVTERTTGFTPVVTY